MNELHKTIEWMKQSKKNISEVLGYESEILFTHSYSNIYIILILTVCSI